MQTRRILGPAVFASLLGFALAPLACSSSSSGVPAIVTQPPNILPDGAIAPKDSGGSSDATTTVDASDAAPIDVTCRNNVRDEGETDIDCGGPKCGPCVDGKGCVAATDCTGKFCELTTSKCSSPTCLDTIRNGNETDVDCGGGGLCGTCPVGRGCKIDKDCATGKCDLAAGACACPTRMVTVSKASGGAYCVDETEVTNADYDRFVRANVPAVAATQPAGCAGNTTFVPTGNWPPGQPLSTSYGLPVRNIDWCDAHAYCKWAGKVLCGDVSGQPIAVAEANNHQKDAWFNACSAQNANNYPYGANFVGANCYVNQGNVGPVSEWSDTGTYIGIPVPGGRMRLCQGGAVGLFQMSGNVAEWENSCDGALATSNCLVRGGSFADTAGATTCTSNQNQVRTQTSDDVGTRCCQF